MVTDSTAEAVGRIVGGLLALAFGIFWTVDAMSMGAPVAFGVFGVVFCCLSIRHILVGIHVGIHNASGKLEIVSAVRRLWTLLMRTLTALRTDYFGGLTIL